MTHSRSARHGHEAGVDAAGQLLARRRKARLRDRVGLRVESEDQLVADRGGDAVRREDKAIFADVNGDLGRRGDKRKQGKYN